MNIDNYAFLTLTQLGLTVLESRIYLGLCKNGKLSTKEISKVTKTAQSDIYRVVKSLQNKGLVEKQIEKPVRYKAISFETGSIFLLDRRKAECKDLQKKISRINRQLKKKSMDKNSLVYESQFVMIPKRENIVRKIGEAIERSEEEVNLVLSWKRLDAGLTDTFLESSERAWSRGVQFEIVVEAPQNQRAKKKAVEFCRINPMCHIRFLPDCPKTVLGVYDKKEVFVIVNPMEDLLDSSALWSNNQSLVTAIHEYFELLWLISMENPVIAQTSKPPEKETP